MLEHQAPIILHYFTLMAENTKCVEVSRTWRRTGSHISARSLCCSVQESCKAEKLKGDDEKVLADPLNPHVRHGRACILCQPNIFHPAFHPECTALLVRESVFILVLVFLLLKQNAGERVGCRTTSITTHMFVPMQSIWAHNTLKMH